MSLHSPDKFSCIFYQPALSPRYYEISTRMFRFLLYGLPLLALVSIAGFLVLGVYFKNIRQYTLKQQKSYAIQLETQKNRLEKEKKELERINNRLRSKMSSLSVDIPVAKPKSLPWGIFQTTPGQKDLSSSPQLAIEKVKAFLKNGKINFHFNLINLKKNTTRLNGFAHVVMKTKDRFLVWPTNKLKENGLMIPFSSGELFSTLRFRPVKAVFDLDRAVLGKIIFLVVVYDSVGDILHKETIVKTISNEERSRL